MKKRFLLIVASLLLSGMMFAQDFYWSEFNYQQWTSYQTVYGKAYLNGELQNRGDIEVAAFVNGELRGRQFLIEPWPQFPEAGYYVWTPCYSDIAGEVITYKAYDHATGILYDLCDTQFISAGTQGSFGSADEPILMHFTRTEEPTYGPEYPWLQSTAYSGEGMLFTAQIKIDGQLVDRATYEVGAFCGEECRGTSGAEGLDDWTDDDLGYFAFMNIMGNNGDIINFYLYDHENECIFPGVCNTTIELENGEEVGIDIYGGDIFVLNFQTAQTFIKPILGYDDNEGDGHYYLIASPIGNVSPTSVGEMFDNEYDLYYFDQNSELEWINIHNGNTDLVSGRGYLYANSHNVNLTFIGIPYDGNGEITLIKDATNNPDGGFEGWNLVGNPFAQPAYVSKLFYTMNETGSQIVAATNSSVEAMEGIFVIAENDGETVTFSTEETEKANSQIVLNVSRNRGNAIDRAIVRFGEGDVLPKFMLNKDHTKVYIPQDNNEYAVVRSAEAGEIPVNFKAAENGNYTISVYTEEVDVNYLHLIDNQTGADIDLLQTPSYSFDALTTDFASRFKLVFATGAADEDVFSFYSNGNWIINNEGEATLQVIDVTGRIMSSEEISGCVSKHIKAAPGVYMLRLIKGNDMKVQKVVVK